MATNIFSEILTWSKQLAPWQNEAIRRLFAKGILSSADKEEIFKHAQIEHSLLTPPEKAPDLMLNELDLPAPPVPGEKIKLKGISNATEVNALKANANLSTGDQLTIIYGENGSGKSGYARVMKKAFRARVIDPVLPNVYTKASGIPASAVFKIEENAVMRDEKWTDGIPSPQCLARFAVFDSKCARVYINENNQLGFLPYGFDIIDGLGAITAEVKKQFQDVAVKSAPKPDALKPLIDTTSIGKMIGTIPSATTAEAIKAKAVWQEADIQTLGEKETSLAKLKAAAPQTLRDALSGRKRQITTVKDSAKSVAETISDAKISEIKAIVADLLKLENAVEVAAKATFGDLNFPGIGGEVWRELLLAAAKYSTTSVSPGKLFPAPEADTKCVLCLQPLDAGARDRLTRFWAFIEDDVSNKRNQAKSALAVETQKLSKLPRKLPKEIEMLEETLRASGSTVFEKATSFYTAATSRIEAIEFAVAKNSWDLIPAEPISLVQDCEGEISGIEKELHAIVDDQKITLTIKTLSDEIAELNARKRLTENLSSVLDHLNALKIEAKAIAASSKITTNGISAKASDLQTKFVTEAFKKKVQDELKPLNLTRVKAGIDKKSEKGKVLHKLTIDGAENVPLDNVFSEGERTALSLSCFLAELSASDDNCGIIFDDPVSSLDHRVRASIVKRLVSEAAVRQIIIFTHDLVFHRELVASAEKQKIAIEFQNVEALGSTTGILTNVPPWPVTKIGQRVAFLEQVLKKAKEAEQKADVAAYKSVFREFYGLLRSTWERSVEELLFNQVVQRYEKEVRTLSLSGVSVDTESVGTVFKGMTRSSAMIDAHDHPAAENLGLPGSAELEQDLEELKAFIVKQKAKNNAAEKAHAHLKK